MGEFELIRRYFSAPLPARPDVVLGVGDDAAIVAVPLGVQLVAATDTLVSGVHFPAATAAHAVGHKALAVNLSDLAAMGAEPAYALLALTLPAADEAWVSEFARGFQALAERHAVALIGGDTTRGPLTITVTVLGYIPAGAAGAALRRDGARVGDAIYVTGTLGDAGLALAEIEGRAPGLPAGSAALRRRLEYPEPRVAAGRLLRGVAHAAIDVSDGLLADLGHVLSASGVGADLDLDAVPLSSPMRSATTRQQAIDYALASGDDYELLFTGVAEQIEALAPQLAAQDSAVTRIGTIVSAPGVRTFSAHGLTAPDRDGYQHF